MTTRMRMQFGQMPPKSEGLFKRVRFPNMATLDEWTADGRKIEADGFGTRLLPQSIKIQLSDQPAHGGSVIAGALHQITVDENGVLSGEGWLIDDANGRKAGFYLKTQSLRGNSIELADVAAELEFTEDFDIRVRFTKANLAGTCIVSRPAFADAYAELSDTEIMAALGDDDEIVAEGAWEFRVLAADPTEIVASAGIIQPWDAFHVSETDKPQKIVVTAEGLVYGHLGLWESCHSDVVASCTRIPRPTDNYASFNRPGVLTDRGIVETGPIFLAGGHPKPGALNPEDPAAAYGGVENAWADVRVTTGRLGPWVSGMVRPGVPDDRVYAARASAVSGHWTNGKLRAIVSVNAEGFHVPGSGFSFSLDEQGSVAELVASFPPCNDNLDEPTHKPAADVNAELRALRAEMLAMRLNFTASLDE